MQGTKILDLHIPNTFENLFSNRFEQTNSDSTQCKEKLGQVCIGGYARVMTMVKKLLKERTEQKKNPIYLNIGRS